jgi:hypothetical protein
LKYVLYSKTKLIHYHSPIKVFSESIEMERPKRKSTEGVAVATKKLTKRSRRQGGTNPSAHQAVGHQVEKQAICNHIEQPAVNDQGEKQAMGDQDGEQAVDDEMEMPRCAKCSKSDGTGESSSFFFIFRST